MLERKISRITGEKLIGLFNLGNIYMSDFVDNTAHTKTKVPLTIALDIKSGLLQLMHTAPPDLMYQNYWYRSGMNQTMSNELKGIAFKIQTLMKQLGHRIVLDIGCNDGTLLKYFEEPWYKVGIDPAKNMAKYARQHAHQIITDYFSSRAYFGRIKKQAGIITTIAMFYDLENPHDFVDDINLVLDNEGLWVVQMSYMPLMLKQNAFDNICHEHLEYYSLSSFNYLIQQHNLKIVDVELNDINGGSFRIYIRKKDSTEDYFATKPYRDVGQYRVESLLEYEKSLELNNPVTYISWFENLQRLKTRAVQFIKSEKVKGKRIWGYGASTKGNTLLQWYGLDNNTIDAIAERNPDKYGKFTIGTNIEIKSEDEMRVARPDYLLILPWHFIAEFKVREKEYLNSGGKFIVPLPQFEVISR